MFVQQCSCNTESYTHATEAAKISTRLALVTRPTSIENSILYTIITANLTAMLFRTYRTSIELAGNTDENTVLTILVPRMIWSSS
jgi:hypothetical protein